MKQVSKHSRAGKFGALIECPVCVHRHTVYHFSWSGLVCLSCGVAITKPLWRFIGQNKTRMNVLGSV